MDKERIEENKKSFNINDDFVFDFVEELGLWIIGGYGPIDIYNDGIRFEHPSDSDLPEGANIFLPYLKECDTVEGIRVYKFNTPYIYVDDIDENDIYFIQCINNGITYFASESVTLLRLFTLSANEKLQNNRPDAINERFRTDDSFSIDYVVLSEQDDMGWWLISNDKYVSIKSWPSQALWEKSYDLEHYVDILLPYLYKINKPCTVESVCYFKIPFWNGGREITEEYIFVIRLSDNTMCFASYNQDALRSFVLNENEMILVSNDWRKAHPYEVFKSAIKEVQHKKQINNTRNIIVNGDMVMNKNVNNEVGYVAPNSIGIKNNKK